MERRFHYLDFDLQIERVGKEYRAHVQRSPGGEAEHVFTLPFEELELENVLLKLGMPRRGIRGATSFQIEDAKAFGAKLFEAVFGGEIQGCWRSSLDQAQRRCKGLRLCLRLTDAPELLDLPWEYLYNQPRNLFYALSQETPLVRYLELPERITPLAVTPPLRALVVIASPKGVAPLNVEREWCALQSAVRDLQERGLLVLERLEQPTVEALQRRLRIRNYHILHFVGHGAFDSQAKDGMLILEDDDGDGHRVSGQSLSFLLHDYRHSLRLVILNACEGGRVARDDPFAGTAQRLVQQGISAVIAMQSEVADETAILFANAFYSATADGFPVDAALAEARKAIANKIQGADWGTPVLYMRADDGNIFDVAIPPVVEAGDRQAALIQRGAETPSAFEVSEDAPGRARAGDPPSTPPNPTEPVISFEAPEGAVRLGSPFYIERSSDLAARRTISQAGTTITIKGPRQVGKSSLLVRIADAARQAAKRVAFLDFQIFDKATLKDQDLFFRQFCTRLTYDLGQEDRVEEYWKLPFGSIMRCNDYMERHLLAHLNSPLVLAMDEVDRLIEADFSADFFGMLRSWHNERSANTTWCQLDLVLVTSTEPYQLIDNLNQSPFNVGEVIDIADFAPEHTADLNARHGTPLGASELQQLTALVGGHPYLVRKALYEMAIGRVTAQQLLQNAADDQGPFAIHLSHLLSRLQRKTELARGMLQIICTGACPDDQVFFRLHSAGLVRRERGAIVPRCRLYADYLKERLHV